MKKLIALALLAFATACGAPQSAPTQSAQPAAAVTTLEVRDGWAAPTPRGVNVAAGYVTIINGTDADERLVSVSSPRAASVSIHEMSMDGAVMRMRALEGGLSLPHGETASFDPGGMHLMFTGVTAPFAEGEEIPVTLTFEHAGARNLVLTVRSPMAHGEH